MGRSFT